MAETLDRLVLVDWLDSHGCASEWEYLSTLADSPPNATTCQSVGWLAYDGKDCIVVVPHRSNSDAVSPQGCGDMTIPKVAVVKITELVMGRRKAKKK